MAAKRCLAGLATAAILLGAAPAAGSADAGRGGLPALSFALARSGCTQEDIPALEIFLTAETWEKKDVPPYPYIRIEVAGTVPGVPATLTLTPLVRDLSQRMLARAELHGRQGDTAWLSGTLWLHAAAPGQRVKGTYDFCQEGGPCAQGEFATDWRPGAARCG